MTKQPKMGNMKRGFFDVTTYEKIPHSTQISTQDILNDQDILLNTRKALDLVGKVSLWRGELEKAAFNSNIMRVTPDPSYVETPRFLNALLNSHYCLKEIRRRAIGTKNVAAVYWRDLRGIPIPLPPLPEQSKIADIPATWDRALESLDQLIPAKTRRKQALMQQLLTGKKRLPGFSGEWETKKLGEILKNRRETNCNDLPLLSITATRGVINRNDLEKKDSSNKDKSKYLRIAPGDIGYNTMRMWQGVSALSPLEGIVSPAYTICTPIDSLCGKFIAHLFKLPKTISLFHRFSQGLVADTLNLKYPNFAVIEVTIPPSKDEQTAIAQVLDTADHELRLLKQQRTTLEKQKRGLMQQLLTGKVRVKS